MVNATSAPVTLTLPNVTTAGYIFTAKKTDASGNAVTLAAAGSSPTIDGAATYTLPSQYKYVKVMSTTTSGQWYVVGNN